MGFRVLLIDVRGKAPSRIHEEFGVVPTEEFEENSESPVTGLSRSNGNYLLYINDGKLIVPDEVVLMRLSIDAELLACYVNETCMESFATAWKNGRETWSVHHDPEQGLEHLELKGAIPPDFEAIRSEHLARIEADSEVDFVFEIPVELARTLGGFRYDSAIEGDEESEFQVLAMKKSREKNEGDSSHDFSIRGIAKVPSPFQGSRQ